MKVAIVILTFNSHEVLGKCLDGVKKCGVDYDIYWTDSNSDFEKYRKMETVFEEKGIKNLVKHRFFMNVLYTRGNNKGIELALDRGIYDYILILNPDVFGKNRWLARMIKFYEKAKSPGAMGAILLFPDGRTIQHAGAFKLSDHIGLGQKDEGQYNKLRPCEWVTGACFLVKTEHWVQYGLLSEGWPHFGSDREYCKMLTRNGLINYCCPVKFTHITQGSSEGVRLSMEEVKRM